MKSYQTVLLAVELIPASDQRIIQKATEMAKEFNAKVMLLHVIEHISSYGAAYGVAVGADIEQMLLDNAKQEMGKLGQKMNIPESTQIIRVGPAGPVILEEAEKEKVDLIILGSHGRHGIRLLLGSTANTVLHGAKCDVLAVRLQS
jgi:universal stress protein A